MNKRQIKKQKTLQIKKISKLNKNRINIILKKLNFVVFDKEFKDGYFMYYFEKSSICWFKLKKFPGWKFAIWLNLEDKTKYNIFGEFDLLIDKFKPNASYVSFEDVKEFNDDLLLILNKDEKHIEYLKEIEVEKKSVELKKNYLKSILNNINNYVDDYNKKNTHKLVFKDKGKNISPRYYFYLSYNENDVCLTLEEEISIYMDLSKEKEKSYNEDLEKQFFMDTFLIEFENFWAYLYSNIEFENNIKRYGWKYQDLTTYLKR